MASLYHPDHPLTCFYSTEFPIFTLPIFTLLNFCNTLSCSLPGVPSPSRGEPIVLESDRVAAEATDNATHSIVIDTGRFRRSVQSENREQSSNAAAYLLSYESRNLVGTGQQG